MPPLLHASDFKRRGAYSGIPFDLVLLDAEERHLRRRVLTCVHDDQVLVDLKEPTLLESGDVLVLDDGRLVEIIACEEHLYQVRGRDAEHLAQLAWHVGNRHAAAQIEESRILIRRDHVLRAMLEGLGASVEDVSEPFHPERGAYGTHAHEGERHA